MKDSIKQIFLARNLWAMRPFYENYKKCPILQQLVGEIF